MTGKSSFRKAWEVLFPYLLYYLTYNAVYLILTFAFQISLRGIGGAYKQFMAAHTATVAGVMGGLCMLIGILPLVTMLGVELRWRRETLDFAAPKETGTRILSERNESAVCAHYAADSTEKLTNVVNTKRRHTRSMTALTVLLAFCVSLGLNALLILTGFVDSSQTYRTVSERQYGVGFAVGLVLYGLISPLAEEVVFRGVIYNRLRRLYNPAIGIAASGILFGAFHGNLVQGVYGACLGILMAYLYERSGDFRTPILFHAVANLAVYTTTRSAGVQELLFTPKVCVVLLAVSAGCILAERRWKGRLPRARMKDFEKDNMS